jgi:hypothetical protein
MKTNIKINIEIKCDFEFWFDDYLNCFCIIDNANYNNQQFPSKSLTNAPEDVITYLYKLDNRIKFEPILYRDIEGIIVEMIPTFKDNKCVNVDFEFKEHSEFNECKESELK